MIRQPAVADRFYPGSRDALSSAVRNLMPSPLPAPRKKALAAVSPHAGYMYSGKVAAETLSAIQIPRTVLLLGLNHHGRGAPVALSLADWEMPMGRVPVDRETAELLLGSDSPIVHDESAHRYEHSVEVQIPFLQALRQDLEIVPIVFSQISYSICEEVGSVLAEVLKRRPAQQILIVASSDMTHYESRESATRKDLQALKQIDQLNPRGLYDTVHAKRISMCGVIPVTIALLTAITLGATKSELIRYTDSGEVSGDTDQVVGYAGIVIS